MKLWKGGSACQKQIKDKKVNQTPLQYKEKDKKVDQTPLQYTECGFYTSLRIKDFTEKKVNYWGSNWPYENDNTPY